MVHIWYRHILAQRNGGAMHLLFCRVDSRVANGFGCWETVAASSRTAPGLRGACMGQLGGGISMRVGCSGVTAPS